MKKTALLLLSSFFLLASCEQGGNTPSSSTLPPSSSESVSNAVLETFLENLGTNVGKITVDLQENMVNPYGSADLVPYFYQEYYGTNAVYQDFFDATYGSPDGIMVHGEQGLFHFAIEGESFVLGDPVCFGTSIADAGVPLLSSLADPSFYARGGDSLHYSSVLKNNVPIAAAPWLEVMGITLDEASFATSVDLLLKEDGTGAEVTFTLLSQESGMPVQSILKATIESAGTLAPRAPYANYVSSLPTLMVPTTFRETATRYLASCPRMEGLLPFPTGVSVQYKEETQFNILQISVDGVNLTKTYPAELKAAGFTQKQKIVNGQFITYFALSLDGEEGDPYFTSSLEVQVQYTAGCSYIVVDGALLDKGVTLSNAMLQGWNEGVYNQTEAEGGHELGLSVPLLPDSPFVVSAVHEDITEYVTYLYYSNGINPYLLACFDISLHIEKEEDALAYVDAYQTLLESEGFADQGLTLDQDGKVAAVKGDASSYGIGLSMAPTYDEEGVYQGKLNLTYYAAPTPYVQAFVKA